MVSPTPSGSSRYPTQDEIDERLYWSDTDHRTKNERHYKKSAFFNWRIRTILVHAFHQRYSSNTSSFTPASHSARLMDTFVYRDRIIRREERRIIVDVNHLNTHHDCGGTLRISSVTSGNFQTVAVAHFSIQDDIRPNDTGVGWTDIEGRLLIARHNVIVNQSILSDVVVNGRHLQQTLQPSGSKHCDFLQARIVSENDVLAS
jgi:hypothetical protein